VLHSLFRALGEHRVRYAVLRNYEGLPNTIGARDIDVLVHPTDLAMSCKLMVDIVNAMGLLCANYYTDERITQFALVDRDPNGALKQIKIDFFTGSEVYGVELFSAEKMLVDAWEYNGVMVVSDSILVLDKWIFTLLVGHSLHPKYDSILIA
jgi:hypothetical protein